MNISSEQELKIREDANHLRKTIRITVRRLAKEKLLQSHPCFGCDMDSVGIYVEVQDYNRPLNLKWRCEDHQKSFLKTKAGKRLLDKQSKKIDPESFEANRVQKLASILEELKFLKQKKTIMGQLLEAEETGKIRIRLAEMELDDLISQYNDKEADERKLEIRKRLPDRLDITREQILAMTVEEFSIFEPGCLQGPFLRKFGQVKISESFTSKEVDDLVSEIKFRVKK